MTAPLITVYIPTYNRLALLKRAIESVLAQDHPGIEVIVVDDGSTDGTRDYLQALSGQDMRVRHFFNEYNAGACASRNTAIFNARGEFITGLDDDDYFLPGRLSGFLRAWQAHPDVAGLYTDAIIAEAKGQRPFSRPAEVTRRDLLVSNFVGNQVFTRTDWLREIGGFDPALPAWQDLDCWYRLLKDSRRRLLRVEAGQYVVDISHPHERISGRSLDRLMQAYERFVQVHALSWRERTILKSHFFNYQQRRFSLTELVLVALLSARPRVVYWSLRAFAWQLRNPRTGA
jgi:glycosyltransferase involved in cell wall biosynthesis